MSVWYFSFYFSLYAFVWLEDFWAISLEGDDLVAASSIKNRYKNRYKCLKPLEKSFTNRL
jgi:hypothetical protein